MLDTSNSEKKQPMTKSVLPTWERTGWATSLISFGIFSFIYCDHLTNQIEVLQFKNEVLQDSNGLLKNLNTINQGSSSHSLFPKDPKGKLESKVHDDWQQFWMAPVKVSSPKHSLMVMPTEVTQGLYHSITGYNPSSEKGNLLPVNRVTWNQTIEFANSFSVLTGWSPCYQRSSQGDYRFVQGCSGWRLPQFSEWIVMAKASQNTLYAGSDNFHDIGWQVDGNLNQVATKVPNSFGLYDLSGNVREFVWTDDIQGMHLGGHETISKMMTKTYQMNPDTPLPTVGFRLVRTIPFESIR